MTESEGDLSGRSAATADEGESTRFRELLDSLADFILVLDQTGRILHVNTAVLESLGYTADELIGRHVLTVHPPDRHEEARDLIAKMVAGAEEVCPIPFLAKDGTLVPVETRVTFGKWNGESAIIGTARRLTDRIQAEREREAALQLAQSSSSRLALLLQAALDVQTTKTPKEALAIVATAVHSTGWESVAAHLFSDWEITESAYVGLSEDEIHYLESIRSDKAYRASMYGEKYEPFRVGRSYFVPAEAREEDADLPPMRRSRREKGSQDTWDPFDVAYVPMRGPGREVIGTIAMDDPIDGQRPREEMFRYLEFFADLAAAVVVKLNLLEEEQKAKEALRASQEKYRAYVQSSPVGIFVLDSNGRFLEANPAACEIKGYPHEELLNLSVADMFPEEERQIAFQAHQQLQATGCLSGEFLNLRGDGERRWVAIDVVSLEQGRFLGFTQDIHERKEAEQSLTVSQGRMRALSEAPFEAIFLSEKGICLDQNLAAENMFGYTPEEAVGRMGTEWIVPEERDAVMKRMIAGEEGPYQGTALRKDGSTFPAEIQARMFEYQGRPARVTALRDISLRKQAEQALRDSEQQNRAILEAIPDMMFIVATDGSITGHQVQTSDESTAGGGVDLDHDLAGRLVEEAAEAIEAARSTERICKAEFATESRSGRSHYEARAVGLSRGQVLLIVRDTTETTRLRTLESRAQRLETAGSIAGQVAHDFNNLLGPLVAYPGLIRDELPEGHHAHEYLNSIETAARQLADINQQLLTLGRRGHYNVTLLDLNEVVTQALKELVPPKSVTVETNLAPDLLGVRGGGRPNSFGP